MQVRTLVLSVMLVSLSGCSLIFGGPSATVKSFMAAAKKGDSDSMTKLFSDKAVQRNGIEKIKSNNQNFAEMSQRAHESGGTYSMNDLKETRTGDTARVSFFYQNDKRTDSIKLVFDLSKEDGSWKIDDLGGAERDEASATTPSPSKPTEVMPLPPRPPSEQPSLNPGGPQTISGGVLNAKATNFPKPAYPPAARAVKAAGDVVVQVTVDEDGNVISANAVSGHPLLRPAATAAARNAKFSPTIVGGKRVKVTGVVNYNFAAQ